jgi:Sulfotransferase family
VEIARAHGYDFLESDVTRGACADAAAPLEGWTPIRVRFRQGRPFAEWIYTGARPLREPFFDDTVRLALRDPFTALFRRETPLDAARDGLDAGRSLPPSGFIFHMSRCGSTLAARMFAALPRVAVVSEAPPIDETLQAALAVPGLPFEEHVRWLQWTVAALGQRRTGGETHYVVKLDAWHIHHLPLLRAAFPETPWIFLYRDPAEVLASQVRSPGKLALPGLLDPRVVGMRGEDITALRREQWAARVLSGFLNAASTAARDPRALFVDYRSLPAAIPDAVAPHFGIELTLGDRETMLRAAQFDAKNPDAPFQPDSEQKRVEGEKLLPAAEAVRFREFLERLAHTPSERDAIMGR